jgi:hypothetical protein
MNAHLNHKAIHYERLIALDEMLYRDTNVFIKRGVPDGKPKEVQRFTLTLVNIFTDIQRTYSWEDDNLEGGSPFPHIPTAFKLNRSLLMYIGVKLEVERSNGLLDRLELDYERLVRIVKAMNPHEEMTVATYMNELWHMYNFWLCHERIYKISTGLIDSLTQTDYPALTDMLRSPNPELFLLLPIDNTIVLPGTHNPMEGAYVNFHRDDNIGKSILSCYLTERPRTLEEVQMPTSYYFSIPLEDGIKMTDALDVGISNMLPTTLLDYQAQEGKLVDLDKELKPIVQLIINSLLYMTSTNADVQYKQLGKKERPSGKRLRKFPHRVKTRKGYYELGGDIIISSHGSSGNSDDATGNGTKHGYRYEVRGHFSHYWMKYLNESIKPHMITDVKTDEFGAKLYLVRKWVKPHWRGQEMADVVLRDYKLKE